MRKIYLLHCDFFEMEKFNEKKKNQIHTIFKKRYINLLIFLSFLIQVLWIFGHP